jgi:hypothetical protein
MASPHQRLNAATRISAVATIISRLKARGSARNHIAAIPTAMNESIVTSGNMKKRKLAGNCGL